MSIALEPTPSYVDPSDPRLAPPIQWEPKISASTRRTTVALAVLSTFAAAWYFTWLLNPAHMGNKWLYGVLISVEIFNVTQAIGFWWTLLGRKPRKREDLPALSTDTQVDVFIPTYSEPVEVVEATVARSTELTGARVNVWLLDDGSRPEMELLAKQYEIGYITREEHSGAKAGNINHALTVTSAPYVLVLDCDHVPLSHFLEATLPNFNDDKVAFVQTPQYYANASENHIAAASWSQQAIFFGAIAQGKDARDSMFCCGTNVIFRREALESIGGFPTNSLTEDFQLSIRMHEDGWKSRYVSETLACGLGPEDMASYVSQQHRWARGCLSGLPSILKARLPLGRRLQYMLSSVYFFSGFTTLVYMALPVIALVSGIKPLGGVSSDYFIMHFAPYYALCLYTLARSGSGSYTFSAFSLAEASFWIQIHGAYRWIFRRPSRFVVTPKQGSSTRQPRAVAPAMLVVAILVGASVYGLVTKWSPGTLNNVAFAMMHAAVIVAGIWSAVAISNKPAKAKSTEAIIDLTETPKLSIVRGTKVS